MTFGKNVENVDNFTACTMGASEELGPCVDIAACVDKEQMRNGYCKLSAT